MKWRFWPDKKATDAETTRSQQVLPLIAERMRQFGHPDWNVHGDLVKGPGSVGIRLRDNHSDSPTHLDLDFILNVDRPEDTTIADCIQGYGRTTHAGWRNAIDMWATVTASTVIEFLTHDGTHAEHFHGNDPQGFPGWHSIHGPVIGFGVIDATPLQQWIVDNPIMPVLAPALRDQLDRRKPVWPQPHTVDRSPTSGLVTTTHRAGADGTATVSSALRAKTRSTVNRREI